MSCARYKIVDLARGNSDRRRPIRFSSVVSSPRSESTHGFGSGRWLGSRPGMGILDHRRSVISVSGFRYSYTYCKLQIQLFVVEITTTSVLVIWTVVKNTQTYDSRVNFVVRYDYRSDLGRKLYDRCMICLPYAPVAPYIYTEYYLRLRLENECNLWLRLIKLITGN